MKRTAIAQLEIALHLVEREALVGHVAKIQREAPRQLGDAEQAEHAARAGLDVAQLPVFERNLQRAVQLRRECSRAVRRARSDSP